MPSFEFPSWILPKESPWEALLKGAQVGNMIAQNRYRNQQMYNQIQQNQVENELRERQFMVQSEGQQLQNNVLRQKFDNDQNDIPLMEGFLKQLQGENDPDKLREVSIPAFKNSQNVLNAYQAQSQKLNMLSGATNQRILADTRIYNMKELDALDPDLRQAVFPYLQDNGLFNPEGIETFRFAKDEQQRRNDEAKLGMFEAQAKITESRQIAVEKVKNLYRAGIRGASSITDKAKLSAFNNELHQITFDPLSSTEEKESKMRGIYQKFGVTPNFAEGVVADQTAFEGEETIYDQEIANVQNKIDTLKVELAKNPNRYFGRKGKLFPDVGTDERTLQINDLEKQKKALEDAKKKQPAPAPTADRVRVRSKDGKIGTVPRSQLEQAQKEGYSLVE